ncbi:MAG: NAD-binding protein [Deltaproteobacteria bacterium]|nr:NAD-binding protein [Deltaproteobacteria bacterium]
MCYSVTGFMYFEIQNKPELSWWDGIWWSFVTMTTVGYGDLFPESWGGRIFVAIPTMAIGIGLLGFILSIMATSLIEDRSKMIRGLARIKMKNHIIICNYPSEAKLLELVGQIRSDEATRGADIVLAADGLDELPNSLCKQRVQFVRGDPARTETLERACIDRARSALVLACDPQDPHSDHTSLAILLTIESIRREVFSAAELIDGNNREFFERTGCDAIVCPSEFTARFLVQELLDPGVQEVVSQLLSTDVGQQLFVLQAADSLAGKRFSDLHAWAATHRAVLLGYLRAGSTQLNPPPDTSLATGDRLVVIAASRPPCP